MRSTCAVLPLYLGTILAMGAAGCGGGGDGFKVAPVSGVVTLNGSPLANAQVRFQPSAKGNPGPPSTGETDDQGNFTLTLSDGNEGAVVGPHKVYISTRKMQTSAENSDIETEIAPEVVPENYRTSPPTFDVPKEGTTEAKFELAGQPSSGQPVGGGPRPGVRND